ncbi:hypothetical protein Syncc8109_1338 [Synechococcus sp. WH 8109]|uniref:hypothetical protein n=1 Tax=Synechococcus sp. WH 8109 TaxID=166314 RepID=UPI0001B8E07F|nr:hypothetical protein [Synechococcus sp. WH 8109]AHF63701.1 hypothetical protein Syncc8109_1338 [Synechococcus sp. WH 8109]
MTDQLTSWDPALLRKFSSTGHFRLLNQLKGDLRKKPLDRDQRTGQLKSLGGNRGATRRSTATRSIEPAPVPAPTAVVDTALPLIKDDQPKSFRDRLNAIDMR